jgi:hypothetical protein
LHRHKPQIAYRSRGSTTHLNISTHFVPTQLLDNNSLLQCKYRPFLRKMYSNSNRAESTPTSGARPDVATILAHPSYPDTIWKLTPTQSGQLPVAAGRGGPFKIDWEVHGSGPIKMIVCISSLASFFPHPIHQSWP